MFPYFFFVVFKGSLTYANDAQLWYGVWRLNGNYNNNNIVIVPGGKNFVNAKKIYKNRKLFVLIKALLVEENE